MKISKLFHWLYATLMFLPIIFFVPSCLYYSFNEHATNTEITTINFKYESNEVNSLNDLVEGNIYYFEYSGSLLDVSTWYEDMDLSFYQGYVEYSTIDLVDFSSNIVTDAPFSLWYNNDKFYLNLIGTEFPTEITYFYCEDVVFSFTNLQQFKLWFTENLDLSNLPQYTDYNVIESVSVNTDDTITDKVNRAWSSVWDLPLFAWTHNSFVAAPFSYITGLFGVGSDNTLNYVFAYFVSISICWLVFDLVMYVPNLAHRWLDRSSLE